MRIRYRDFIEAFFVIKDKEGNLVRFKFNDTQNYYYDLLMADYDGRLDGVRENILKFRQPGFSSLITGIFATDFIMSEMDLIPLIDSDVYSHKDSETAVHIERFNLFLNSWMVNNEGGDYLIPEHRLEAPKLRKHLLRVDNGGELVGKRGAQYHAQTASAKVSGRGGTKQNIHWSEVAFYPNTEIMNAETLVTGAEEQVPAGHGKIFRETTGNLAGDFFAREYRLAKDGESDFKSRFLGWYVHREYATEPPIDWEPPKYYARLIREHGVTTEQCYWHYTKTRGLTDAKRLREYPSYDTEAFLMSGQPFFDKGALQHYTNNITEPIKEVMYAQAL